MITVLDAAILVTAVGFVVLGVIVRRRQVLPEIAHWRARGQIRLARPMTSLEARQRWRASRYPPEASTERF